MINFKAHCFELLSLLVIAVFVIYKIPFLSLPYYWDEAWVYGPAVSMMAELGPSLSPDILPVSLSRGHPLLYHFLGGWWGVMFGNNIFSLHVFSLIISILLLTSTFLIGKELFGKKIGFFATLTLSLQPLFLAQSILVLPEVTIALFSLIAMYYYVKQKWLGYFLFCASAILVKESGVIILCATLMHHTVFNFTFSKKSLLLYIKKSVILISPILPWFIFLLVQKQQNGWLFFPEHIGYVSFELSTILDKLESYAAMLFIYQGRNLYFFSALGLLVISAIKGKKFYDWKTLVFFLIFTVGFIAFSSLNFFSNRYLMPALVPFIFLCLGLIKPYLKNTLIITASVVCILTVQYLHIQYSTNSDHNQGYVDPIKCHQELINYCNQQQLNNKHFYVFFIGRELLTNPRVGYVSDTEIFNHVSKSFAKETEYCIFANFDSNKENLDQIKTLDLALIKRVEYGKAWAELYKVNKP